MACTPTFTASGIHDAGQEFHLTGKITFAVGDTYPSGGIPITTVFNCITEKSGKYPYDIYGTAFNPMFTGAPANPTVAAQGTPGLVTWGYTIVKKRSDGTSLASAEVTIANGVADLTAVPANFNRITAVVVAGFEYDLYRTTAGTTPNTTGLIATSGLIATGTTSYVWDDKGTVAGTGSVPSDSTASPLYEAWFDKTAKTLRLGGETAECSSTSLDAVTINVSAWAKRITG